MMRQVLLNREWVDGKILNCGLLFKRMKDFLLLPTKDLGIFALIHQEHNFGILLLRPDEDGIRPVLNLLQQVLNSYNLEDLVGATTVATPRGIRLRRS